VKAKIDFLGYMLEVRDIINETSANWFGMLLNSPQIESQICTSMYPNAILFAQKVYN
jgi:hypothetical protein